MTASAVTTRPPDLEAVLLSECMVVFTPWLWPIAIAEGFFVLAYNLEWFDGRFHDVPPLTKLDGAGVEHTCVSLRSNRRS